MNRFQRFMVFTLGLILMMKSFSEIHATVYAQDEQPTPSPEIGLDADIAPTTVPGLDLTENEIQSSQQVTIDLTDLGINEIILRGVFPSYSFYLPFPDNWDVGDIRIDLNISHTPLLRADSVLSLEINDIPLDSIALTKDNVSPTTWSVRLPRETYEDLPGINVKLIGFMRITYDDICEDIENPANWTRIAADSTISIGYELINYVPELSDFPSPFIQKNNIEKDETVLLLPGNANGVELSSVAYLTGYLTAKATWRGQDIFYEVIGAADDQTLRDNNLIIVSKLENLTPIRSYLTALPFDIEVIDQSTGIIMLMPSPWNPSKAMLVVAGKTDQGLTRASKALISSGFPALARGSFALITQEPDDRLSIMGVAEWKMVSLEQLGYADQTISGIGKQTIRYVSYLPASSSPSLVNFNVIFSHSPFVSTELSYVTLWVNGSPVAGEYLLKKNEQRGMWNINIPVEVIDPGSNSFEFIFDLQLRDEGECDEFYYDKAWAVIHKESSLAVDFSDIAIAPKLENFPMPFGESTVVVIPDSPTKNEVTTVIRLMQSMGAQLGGLVQKINVLPVSQVNEDITKTNHLILIGQPNNNPLVIQVLKNAVIRFDGTNRKIVSDLIKLDIWDVQNIGFLQGVVSPWNSSRSILVITGTNDAAIGWASNLIADANNRSRLKGDVALIDGKGRFTFFDSEKPQLSPGVEIITDGMKIPLQTLIYVSIGVVGLIFLFVIFVVIRRLISKSGNEGK